MDCTIKMDISINMMLGASGQVLGIENLELRIIKCELKTAD